MSSAPSLPVMVVGAGPVGLTLACELARLDVAVRIIDLLPAPTTESRAILVHSRSLEMFARMGVIDELIASGIRTVGMDMFAGGHRLARVSLAGVSSAYPFSVTTAQTETERILAERLAGYGVHVERGVQATGFEQDEAGVDITLTHAEGRAESVRCDWLVGTDGARSTVRKAMGSKLVGSFEGQRFLLGDVDADYDCERDHMQMFFAAHEGPLAVFPMEGQRLRLIAQVPDRPGQDDAPAGEPDLATLQAVVDRRADGMRLLHARWITYFEIHHAQVPAYRSGRVFLAGDAAHVHSPAGGQGMNTGMQDAFNLGWKLAYATRGVAGADALLDSYDAERHPVAARVIHDSTALTDVGTASGPVQRQLRNAALRVGSRVPGVQHRIAAEIAETDVTYRGSSLGAGRMAGDVRPGDAAAQVRALPGWTVLHFPGHAADDPSLGDVETVVIEDVAAAHRYGLRKGGYVAVRPDGYVGFIGHLDERTSLESYLDRYARAVASA